MGLDRGGDLRRGLPGRVLQVTQIVGRVHAHGGIRPQHIESLVEHRILRDREHLHTAAGEPAVMSVGRSVHLMFVCLPNWVAVSVDVCRNRGDDPELLAVGAGRP